jgi:dihydroorotase
MYSAHAALELYAEAFEEAGALDKLEGFASLFGPNFYEMPRNPGTITLRREEWSVPGAYAFGGDVVVPMRANEKIRWRMISK